MPDLYHRAGSPFDLIPGTARVAPNAMAIFKDDALRAQWRDKFFNPATDPKNLRTDFTPVFEFLDAQGDVKKGGVATTGYCMGGNISLRLAALFPDRVGACASFHGGGLATDDPGSPHRGADKIKARVYVAGAIEDTSFTDAQKQTLIDALNAAGVKSTVETYQAKHGFAVPDHMVHDAAAAERHYAALGTLLRETVAR
jgi:carboxymethylenebutenolidase